MPRCFVMQPFDGDEFDKRYDEVYGPAIIEAGFEAYRVDRDPAASIPIMNIESGIKQSAVCFADISIDNPNVWFELGFAICANKPLCLVCVQDRIKFPFDVQHRKIIRYKKGSPSDFSNLRCSIVERLKAIEDKDVELDLIINNISVELGGVSDLEFSALCIIFENQDSDRDQVSFYIVENGMERAGYTKIASRVSVTSLVKKGMIISSSMNDDDGRPYSAFQVTERGTNLVVSSLDKISLKKVRKGTPSERVTQYAGELDEDIPF